MEWRDSNKEVSSQDLTTTLDLLYQLHPREKYFINAPKIFNSQNDQKYMKSRVYLNDKISFKGQTLSKEILL